MSERLTELGPADRGRSQNERGILPVENEDGQFLKEIEWGESGNRFDSEPKGRGREFREFRE